MNLENNQPKKKRGCLWWIGLLVVVIFGWNFLNNFVDGFISGYNSAKYQDENPSTTQAQKGPVIEKKVQYQFYTDVKRGVTSLGDVWYDVLVIVENIGEVDIYLDGGSLEVEDASGVLVQKEDLGTPAPKVITTGQKGVYKEAFLLDSGVPEKEYKIIANVSVKKATSKHQYMTVSDVNLLKTDSYLHEEGCSFKIVGRVENSLSEEEYIYIYAFLYDSHGNILDVIHTSEMVSAKSKGAFEMDQNTWYREIKYDDIARYKVVAYPYLYQFD